jgi:hypothetical protein
MTEFSSQPDPSTEIDSDALLTQLRRKEGSWVEWGKACQALQKAGHSPQAIFEASGFEPIQQNQIIVGMQVYEGLVKAEAPAEVLEHFGHKGSDILYELRVLTLPERPLAAALILSKQLDQDDAHDIVRSIKQFTQLRQPPEGFTSHPGDTVAFQAWRLAQQTSDLQERSRLIARALKFAASASARQQIEKLLTDFSVVPSRPAPRLPIYRLETDHELPRVIPVVGKLPLTRADLQSVPIVESIEPFRMVKYAGEAAWVAIPGWQVVRNAVDPVAILADHQQLAELGSHTIAPLPEGSHAEVLLIVDRADRQWQTNSFFLTAPDDLLQMEWFEQDPHLPLLGRLLIVVRPPRILDENVSKDPWQIDE